MKTLKRLAVLFLFGLSSTITYYIGGYKAMNAAYGKFQYACYKEMVVQFKGDPTIYQCLSEAKARMGI